jgi:predicted PurR-regulated permease PerM
MASQPARTLQPRKPAPGTPDPDSTFIRRLMIIIAVALFAAAVWFLSDVLLLFFGSVLVAVILRALANPLRDRTGMPDRVALAASGTVILASLVVIVLFIGPELNNQMNGLYEKLPTGLDRLAEMVRLGSISDLLKGAPPTDALGGFINRALSWGSKIFGAAASVLLVLFGGLYLSLDPQLYREGFLKLVPPRLQANVAATIDDCSEALLLWIAGQLFAMFLVGALTGIGLWLVGVPSALALGVIAGLAEFIPFIGPLLAAVPALVLASTQNFETVAWTAAVLVGVQQLESNLIMPLIANRTISVLPAVGLYAVVVMALLFGPLGLLFGFPLAIVADIAIRRLYIRDALDEPVEILGEPAKPSDETVQSDPLR